MRNTIIGIVIGIVVGVMVGASIIAPRLEQARPTPNKLNGQAPELLNVTRAAESPASSPAIEPPQRGDVAPLGRLRVASSFPLSLPHLGEMAMRLEAELARLSDGDLSLKIYDPGVMVPVADTLKAVRSGALDAAFSSPGQWAEGIPALMLFSAVPFGPSVEEYLSWFYFGGGEQIFNDLYKDQGVHAIICGAIPTEASGWFRRPVRSIGDFKGQNIRASGLGAKVLERLGANTIAMDDRDIFAALKSGKIDAVEFSMPSVDKELNLHQVAKHYYFPGWHQPAALYQLIINNKTWKTLKPAHRAQIELVCGDNVRFGLAQGGAGQFEALKELGLKGVEVHRWPEIVLSALHRAWFDVVRDETRNNNDFARTWASLEAFRRDYAIWDELSGL